MLCCLTCFEFLWFCLGLVPLYFALFDGFVGGLFAMGLVLRCCGFLGFGLVGYCCFSILDWRLWCAGRGWFVVYYSGWIFGVCI